MTARFLIGDVFDVLGTLPDDSVDLVMTSPPFLALRSYLPADHPDKAKEIGSEATPADFLDTLLDLTEEWGRVLAPHGSICVELGDTYSGSGGAGGDYNEGGLRDGQGKVDGSARRTRTQAANTAHRLHPDGSIKTPADRRASESKNLERVLPVNGGNGWPLDKSLTLIPTLYAASLAYGRNLLNPDHTFEPWRVRNLVAWVRPNPPVGALGDKVRPATSFLTWATRSRTRWFDLDAVRGPSSPNTNARTAKGVEARASTGEAANDERRGGNFSTLATVHDTDGAPPLDWWKISPGGYQGAHYATYPEELCRIPIEASCPRRVCLSCGQPSRRETDSTNSTGVGFRRNRQEGNERAGGPTTNSPKVSERETTGWSTCGCPGTDGIRLDGYHTGTGWRPGHVLDPFGGSGTTAVVATGRGRDCTLIDIDDRNADLARERLGMFLTDVIRVTEEVTVFSHAVAELLDKASA